MRVAVLHQAIEPPAINGVRKPKKPGGYQDSGADIAYVLRRRCDIPIVTPTGNPDPEKDDEWCFPDSEDGIVKAIQSGATCLWANTVLFARHPLQASTRLDQYASKVRVVGQPPKLVEAYDDKNLVNDSLRSQGGFTMPTACLAGNSNDIEALLKDHDLKLPVVAKPIRGRGSQGVKVCHTMQDLIAHIEGLGANNTIIEQYLSGTEATVTVMPPSDGRPDYWAMPVVVRFNHQDGIAPYNGAVAVTANSRAISTEEVGKDPGFAQVSTPIRIDVRRASGEPREPFVLFDVNMKPNMTAPGRPGREDQASLTAMAAAGLGWSPAELLQHILSTSTALEELRRIDLPAALKR